MMLQCIWSMFTDVTSCLKPVEIIMIENSCRQQFFIDVDVLTYHSKSQMVSIIIAVLA